jgi:O-antigen ligase
VVASVRRLPLSVLAPVLVGVTIVAFAAGSSSVQWVRDLGQPLRWVALFALFAAAALWAAQRRGQVSPSPLVVVPAAAFLLLALGSALWSVDARLTASRAASFALLLTTAGLLALACAGRRRDFERVLIGVLGGAAAVALLGVLVLGFDHDAAVQARTPDLPARFRGLGENPNTVALLLGICLPIACWFVLQPGSPRWRLLAALAVGLGFDASIIASGSRGGLYAGFAGCLLVAALVAQPLRWRAAAVGAVGALAVVSVVLALIPTSQGEAVYRTAQPPPPPAATPSPPPPPPRYVDVQGVFPLDNDVGNQVSGQQEPFRRSLFGLSGRGIAWRGALDLGNERPVLGYGFGTESHVFVDRYVDFQSSLPEDSYLGLYLQLGSVGLVAFLLLVVALGAAAVRSRPLSEASVSLGVLLAALVLAVIQSYVYSVGNIGTAAVWIAAFLGAGAAAAPALR